MSGPDIMTLGCRLNAYEAEVMRRHATEAGLDDCVIVNTCAVTGEAVRQARQTIRRLRRERPDVRIVVTGCAAQIEPERFAEMDEVDHVFGNGEKMRKETWTRLQTGDIERVQVDDIMSVTETAAHMIDGLGALPRAFVQVQNGCDHRCTYCIIPYGRGPSRSVPAGEVVSEIRRIAGNGVNEVVLTGVDVTSYGADLPGQPTLGKLVRQILKHVPELPRLRISSIDQVEADTHLLDAMASEPRLMPHLHLSLQSGDERILKRMKRRHSPADAVRFCAKVRELRPDVVFGADLIAGFPTETEEMFQGSLRHVEDCGLTYLHVFPFSPRKGTPAARMPQVETAVIKHRAARLREAGEVALAGYLSGMPGSDVEVLMEAPATGRTPQFAEVKLSSAAQGPRVGSITHARVARHDGRRLFGEVIA